MRSARVDSFGTGATGGAAVNGGGAAGGDAPNDGSGVRGISGGGGGGGSFVFTSSGVPLLVAGGAGGNAGGTCTGGIGGGAGSPPTAGGALSGYEDRCTVGGGAGGTSAGGTPGPGGLGGSSGAAGSGSATNSLPGAGGSGGTGSTTSGSGSAGGGGGGGGYYGGGGGGGSSEYQFPPYAGGGGGGSGYAAAVMTDVSGEAGVNGGAGVVTFSYADPVAAGAPSYEAGSGQALAVGTGSGLLSSSAGNSGPAGDTLAVTLPSTTTAHGGTVTVDANGDGGFTYTSAAGFTGTDTFTYNVTDTTDGSGDYATGTATIDVLAALQVSTMALPAGEFGSAYHQSLVATGGTGPYSWSVSGLPPGLSVSPSGVLSGDAVGGGGLQPYRLCNGLEHPIASQCGQVPVAHRNRGPAQYHRLQRGHDLRRRGAGHHARLQRPGGR